MSKDNDLINNNNLKTIKSKKYKKILHREQFLKKVENTQNNDSNANIAKNLNKVRHECNKNNTSDHLGVTALVAIMEPATESQNFRRKKLPLKSCSRKK